MNTIILFLKTRLNTLFGKAVLGLLISCAFLRWPVLTNWMGADVHDKIMAVCYEVKSWGLGIILLFAKSWNQTGGTVPTTPESKLRTENN
jgi:hypothetical protein